MVLKGLGIRVNAGSICDQKVGRERREMVVLLKEWYFPVPEDLLCNLSKNP